MQFDEMSVYVFLLASFLGLELIKKVSPLLHTPLMSLNISFLLIYILSIISQQNICLR